MLECLLHSLHDDLMSACFSLLFVLVPIAGWRGAKTATRGLLTVFWALSAVAAAWHLAAAVVMAAVVMPALACLCDPECRAAANGVDGADFGLEGSVLFSAAPVAPSPGAACGEAAVRARLLSVAIALLETALHSASAWYTRRLASELRGPRTAASADSAAARSPALLNDAFNVGPKAGPAQGMLLPLTRGASRSEAWPLRVPAARAVAHRDRQAAVDCGDAGNSVARATAANC